MRFGWPWDSGSDSGSNSVGTGLAKVEAAAKTTRLVSDQRSKRAVMTLLTESQEGGKDTDELHCDCGGFSRRR